MKTVRQIELFDESSPISVVEFEVYLNEGGRRPIELKITRNRVSMISVEFMPDGAAKIRAHEAFLKAPTPVLASLRKYVRTRRKDAWKPIAEYVHQIRATHPSSGSEALTTRGEVYDLKTIYDAINHEFFNGSVTCRIGWGRGRPPGRRGRKSRSIRYGSFDATTVTIRVHPILDDSRVSAEFLRYIVFHEMLHTIVPEARLNGRRYDHSLQFCALERTFPRLDEMQALAQHLLDVLI